MYRLRGRSAAKNNIEDSAQAAKEDFQDRLDTTDEEKTELEQKVHGVKQS